jgi:signal transduction histidine kinase
MLTFFIFLTKKATLVSSMRKMFRTDIYFHDIFAEICVIQEQMRAAASQNLLFFAKKFRENRNVLTIFANIFEKTKFRPYRFDPIGWV